MLGAMITSAVSDRAIDELVTPQGMLALWHKNVDSPKTGPQTLQDLSISHYLSNAHYDAWDRFSFTVEASDGTAGRLVFFRSGLFTWRVHAIDLLQQGSVHQVSARRAALRRPVAPVRPGCLAYGPVHTFTGHVTAETFPG